MKLQDYLPLYKGCEVLRNNENLPFRLTGNRLAAYIHGDLPIDSIKLLLRPFSDITEEEFRQHFYDHWLEELDVATFEEQYREVKCWTIKQEALLPEHFHFLLSKHFDLFGLIPAGLAIDKTKEVAA
jgi:hypothetical protein